MINFFFNYTKKPRTLVSDTETRTLCFLMRLLRHVHHAWRARVFDRLHSRRPRYDKHTALSPPKRLTEVSMKAIRPTVGGKLFN